MFSNDILEQTYEIIEEIGSGGGGVVYHAVHKRLQTDVVIKKIKDEVLGKIQSRAEADVLKKLKHPYLPRVYDFIETDEGVYTVMDYVKGKDMEKALSEHGPYSQAEVKKWAEQLGEALDYLHRQDPPIIHSDIKPANIMLTPEGDICLIDFNISLAMGNNEEVAVGISPGFSPPEQYRDPEMFMSVTQDYTLQEQMQESGRSASDASDNVETYETTAILDDTKTVLLNRDDNKTVLLDRDDSKTVLLDRDDSKTVLLDRDDDKTVVLDRDDSKTVLLNRDDDKSVLPKSAPPVRETPILQNRSNSTYLPYIGKGITTRSDIFSLGMCLITFLTGQIPECDFDKNKPVKDYGITISEGLASIIDSMVKVNPDERYKDGTEFLDAIRNCYKYDRKYVSMHRKEISLRIVSGILAVAGVGCLTVGFIRLNSEKSTEYFEQVNAIEAAISAGEYENAQILIDNLKSQDKGIDAYYEEMFMTYSEGDYNSCVKLGEEYTLSRPFYVETEYDKARLGDMYYLLANSTYELGNITESARYFEEALANNNQNPDYYRDYAIALAKSQNTVEAQKALDQAIEKGLTDDSISLVNGELYYLEGDFDNAVSSFKETISITGDNAVMRRAVLLAADAYLSATDDKIDEAIVFLSDSLNRIDPGSQNVIKEKLAEAYCRKALSNPSEAKDCYGKAVEVYEQLAASGYSSFQILENIGILYENMGEIDKAESTFTKMLTDYPDRYEVNMRLAYLEIDRQQSKDVSERDYHKFKEYYDAAFDQYNSANQDIEMDRLSELFDEIKSGGWMTEE